MVSLPTTAKKIQKYLDKFGLLPQKKLGQNFLLPRHIHQQIVAQAELDGKESVLEIGPGLGHLTTFIISQTNLLWCVEIDTNLAELLQKNFGCPKLNILTMDVLKNKHNLNPELVAKINSEKFSLPYKIIANLPYNISAPLIVNFLEMTPPPSLMVVTVQKEVALRLIASPQTSHYGPLTLNTRLYADISVVMDIPPSAFYPKPKVTSSVVKIRYQGVADQKLNKSLFKQVVAAVFNLRRKTVANALHHASQFQLDKQNIISVLESCEIDPRQRGESIPFEKFIDLTHALEAIICQMKKE